MATPFQLLRVKALNLAIKNNDLSSIHELFDILNFIYIFTNRASFYCSEVNMEIDYICSISNFKEEFLELIEIDQSSIIPLSKRELSLNFITQAFETMECSRVKFNKIKNLSLKNKNEGFYFKEIIKGFKPSTPFEIACVYLIKTENLSISKTYFESIGFDVSFFENLNIGTIDRILTIGRMDIPFCLRKTKDFYESLFLPIMSAQNKSILINH